MRIVADNPELRIALSRDQTVEAFPDEVPFVRCLAVFDQLLSEQRLGFQFAALLAIQLAVQHALQRESDHRDDQQCDAGEHPRPPPRDRARIHCASASSSRTSMTKPLPRLVSLRLLRISLPIIGPGGLFATSVT